MFIYGGLVALAGRKSVKPAIAESWTQSVDGMEWVFTLRRGLRWSDGSVMKASEIAQSLNRILEGTAHTKFSDFVKSVDFSENGGRSQIAFHLKKPAPANFLTLLAFADCGITHPSATAKPGAFTWLAPVSGPYTLVSRTHEKIQLAKNPHYWNAEHVGIESVVLTHAEGGVAEIPLVLDKDKNWDTYHVVGDFLVEPPILPKVQDRYRILRGNVDFLAALSFSRKRVAEGKMPVDWRRNLLTRVYDAYWGPLEATHDPLQPVGMRPPGSYGAMDRGEFKKILGELRSNKSPTAAATEPPKTLEVLLSKKLSEFPTSTKILAAIRAAGYEPVLRGVDSNDVYMKLFSAGDYDLCIRYMGASEDDPDTAWRMYIGTGYFPIEIASPAELDQEQSEKNPKLREEKYQAFERKLIREAALIPLKYESTVMLLSKRVEIDRQHAIDWGLSPEYIRWK